MSDLKWTSDDKAAAYVKLLSQQSAEAFNQDITAKLGSAGMFQVKIVGD